MANKRVLLLDGSFLTAYQWSNGHLKVEGEFSHEPAGLEGFADHLKKHKSSLFYLLADVAEEGFQLEDLPYVQGSDRNALLQRRLSQYYYNTPLSAAISLGRGTEGRRDEKMLFAALTRAETFTPWLETLQQSEARLAGVYSVPLAIARCAPQLLGAAGPALLVTLSRGGVRQTFFDRGELHFSRLSPLATHSAEEVGRASAADAAKIFQYLVAQRQVPRGVALRTLVLAHAEQIPALKEFCTNTNELRFEFVDITDTARRLGLKDSPRDSNADSLFMHCLVVKTPPQQFAPEKERRFFRLWQIRSAMTSAAWIILAGCLMFAGKTALNVYELGESTDATKLVTATEAQRYRSILDGLPSVSITPDNLRAVMARFDALQKRTPAIEPLLTHLSMGLNDTPRIELVRLSWKIADSLDAGDKSSRGDARGASVVPTAVASAAAGTWAVIELQAQLPLGLAADKRAQIELIEGFAARLRDAKTDVRVLSRPFDIESDKALKSTGEAGDTQLANAPRFSLRIARLL